MFARRERKGATVNDRMDEQVALLDRMRRINPSSREITVAFHGTSGRVAWPDGLAGTIVAGITDAEFEMLISPRLDRAELYVTNRVSHDIPRKRYLLTDLQWEAPGRFRFKAMLDFDPSLRVTPK